MLYTNDGIKSHCYQPFEELFSSLLQTFNGKLLAHAKMVLSVPRLTKEYTGIYSKQYTKTYLGIYVKQYDQGWIAAYTKEYSGQYTKHYEKTYGGAYSGPGNQTAYLGLAHFTNNYAGERAFHQSYIGAATTNAIAQSTRAGNLTNNARVKIGNEWKSVIRTRVKKDGEWKIVGKTRIKDTSGNWQVVAVDHERVTLNITSNTANFNVKDEIENLGFNLLTKPFQVNVNVAPGVFVYSSNTSKAAFDTGFKYIYDRG